MENTPPKTYRVINVQAIPAGDRSPRWMTEKPDRHAYSDFKARGQ